MVRQRTAEPPWYGGVAKALHWLIVAILIAQFAVAWTMPDIHRGTQPGTLINLHLSIGSAIWILGVLRLLWRLRYPVPLIGDNVSLWQQRAAETTHALLYLLLFFLPLMGWANASSRGWAVDVFGVIALPNILPAGSSLGQELGDVHVFASYALLALVGLHVAAALYHHFWLRDRVLARMLPGSGE